MEYQKMKTLLYDTLNQPSKFRTKKLAEINDKSQRTYNGNDDDNNNNNNNNIKFKMSIATLSLYYYSEAYILVKGTIVVPATHHTLVNNANGKLIFKYCAPFTS